FCPPARSRPPPVRRPAAAAGSVGGPVGRPAYVDSRRKVALVRRRGSTYRGRVTPPVWLAVPLVALLRAPLWAAWAGRERGPGAPVDTVAAYQRFVRALERSRGEPTDRSG